MPFAIAPGSTPVPGFPASDSRFHTYHPRRGTMTERQRYIFADSTLVQEVFTFDDAPDPLDALEDLLRARRWRFLLERYAQEQARVGDDGFVVAGPRGKSSHGFVTPGRNSDTE